MRNGKVALVTGSSTGIGAAVAKQLAKDGYDIAVHYSSSPEAGEQVHAKVLAEGVNGCLLHGNIADPEVPDRLIAECVEKLGRLDVLINNAGITRFEDLRQIKPETMDSLYNLDFRGMILCAKAAANYMVPAGIRGVILFNTSIRAFSPHTSDAVYAGLKAGLNRAIESFAIDLGRYGIRVNGFSPGVIDVRTPEDVDSKDSMWYKDHWRYIPLRRVGRPVDMGNVVSLLVSDKADYITGQVIRADGGLSVFGAPDNMGDIFRIFDIKELVINYDEEKERKEHEEMFKRFREEMERQKREKEAKEGK
jgi:NAD(P)-dependent dehydrogenase (short-subunit alcohol dehydrogenase family)